MSLTTIPFFMGGMRVGAFATVYNDLNGTATANASITNMKSVWSLAGNFTKISVRQLTAAGAGTSVFTLYKNGSSTGLTCTILASTSTISATGSVAVVAGDVLSVQCVNNGSVLRVYAVSFIFTPTTAGECSVTMGPLNQSAQTMYHAVCAKSGTSGVTESNVQFVMPCDGVLDKLYNNVTTGMASGKTLTSTVRVNSVDSTVVAVMAALATQGSDLTHSISVVKGDLVSIRAVHTDAFPSFNCSHSMRFVPSGTRVGQPVWFYLGGNTTVNPRTYAATAFYPGGPYNLSVNQNPQSTDPFDGTGPTRWNMPGTFYCHAFYVWMLNGPGAAKTSNWYLRTNGAHDSPTCALTGAGTGAGISKNSDLVNGKTWAVNDSVNLDSDETISPTNSNGGSVALAINDSDIVQTFSKTIAQAINFSQTLSLQGFIIRSITASTVTKIQGGGRQIVKTAAGVLWHVYYEGGYTKTSYSSDNGLTWTVVTVGPTWVPTGMAIAIGAGDAPILVLTKASNDDFYIYQWNGTTWVLKKQLNSPSAESESVQILYFGTTYMLVSGYITSTGDRRVYCWTSTNLTSWTSLQIKNGDSSGTGPQKYRRVAACVDASNNVHAVYSIRSSSTHTLFYRKYSGGAWGTEETIATGYGGNNIGDFHSGISIAVDDLGYVHVACRQRSTLYTSRVRLAYYKRTTTWAAVEYVHDDVDADQEYPSLSLNQRTAVVCWSSSGLGYYSVYAKRGSDGTWALQNITTNTRDSVNTVHGPSYGSSFNYTRGVVGSMRGSEEYFYSSDIISGNAAAMETTLNFTSILSTQRRVLSNMITFTSALSAIRGIGLSSVLNFTQRLNFARTRTMAGTIDFQQHLEAALNTQPIHHTINFTSLLSGIKSPIKSISQTINFTSRLNRVVSSTVTNSIAFSGVLVANIIKRQTISQSIAFVSRVTYNASLKKTMSNVLNFFVGLVAMKADEGCQPSFTPERPLPASEDDVNIVYLIGPLPSPSLTVQLKRPEYGNSRRQALQVKVNRTRGGKLRPHARTPTYEPQSITFESLSYLKLEQVRNFLRVCKGKKIYYLDEKNRKWIGYITTSDIDLAEETRDRGGQFTLDFEGILAS
jgi:hypothetical protein